MKRLSIFMLSAMALIGVSFLLTPAPYTAYFEQTLPNLIGAACCIVTCSSVAIAAILGVIYSFFGDL